MESGAQVAGGVIIYPESFQKKIAKISRRHDVLFVLDENATGFGRLGSMIEYKTQDSIPDIVSFGKMLTGGYLPLADTLTNKKVYDAFLGSEGEMKHFFHGHTFTGNPLACGVAIANLALYKKQNLIPNIKKRAGQFKKRLGEISKLDLVGDVRQKGLLMGMELVSDKKTKMPPSPQKRISQKIFNEAKRHKVYLRTLGHIVMLVPPLAISENEFDFLVDKTIDTITQVTKQIK
jgi:adenosylmethionine-8-amino-7-oxononanoate aminotransferase